MTSPTASLIPDISAEFDALVEACKRVLVDEATPVQVSYEDRQNLANNALPIELIGRPINLYALWTRKPSENAWDLMYIGQRQSHSGLARIKQHLFKVPKGTQSKVALVHAAVAEGLDIGVSGVLIAKDALRLAVEEQLIAFYAGGARRVPWNKKASRRGLKLGRRQ